MRSVPLKIAIIGDFDRGNHSHWATEASLFHAAAKLGIAVEPRWFASTSLSHEALTKLEQQDAIWAAPGSPYASANGVLRAIEYARVRDRVFLGTCAGFQHALIEFTRNVLGVVDADSAENATGSDNAVITLIQCALPVPAGTPRLHGQGAAHITAGSTLERLCGSGDLRPEYFCSFEVNPRFVARWEAAGLRTAARGAEGEMRAFELPDRRFFIASLFQPQLSSSFDAPHPIIVGFLRAACSRA